MTKIPVFDYIINNLYIGDEVEISSECIEDFQDIIIQKDKDFFQSNIVAQTYTSEYNILKESFDKLEADNQSLNNILSEFNTYCEALKIELQYYKDKCSKKILK